ncbi:uncharacterized protein LAESUDRAFT_721860 [Laetiporus sulphureus 93-53]|uniref:Uncharacterized protein n=1 Tax=Laetiporus sulphureus 93-53 TaxID=1314785 RepID=A0A165GKW4_9APHY|nr:uncharacterized protein LAESUDRAFT_721860 [Laetiporus sulphureus 93-53]KZT10491.1 hypothetical protein LAESUDRAFT_721860 [Laetiporus sulphureus 93-53]
MFRLPTLVSLLILAAAKVVVSSPCVAFDSNFNLLVFGLDGKDWSAGTQSSWTNGTATDITASGRPSFDGTNTTCYLAQFYNSIYFMNAQSNDTSSVYIYDAATKSWSTQSVTTGSFSPSDFTAILDHDTNVFYALSGDSLYYLDMGALTAANSSALSWVDVEQSPYGASYSNPVMALAQNHVHFLDVPGVSAGEAKIYVIHYSYFQPTAQAYPLSNGSTGFPAAHGKTASFFQSEGVQQEFAFIPDDGSATYVINVETNTTAAYAGPTKKDADATYAASITALVQLDSEGNVIFFPYTEDDASVNAAASWTTVKALASVAPASSSASSTATASGAHSSGTGTTVSTSGSGSTSTGSASSGSSSSSNGSMAVRISHGLVVAGLMGAVACLL